MNDVNIIGIDLAKNSFQLHGARSDGSVAFRKKLGRDRLMTFLAEQPHCIVAMEACATAPRLGPRDCGSGACRQADPAAICEAVLQTHEK